MTRTTLSTACAALLLAVTGVASADSIDTTGSWDGSNAVSPFGETNTATYGQTFTVGAHTSLNSFTFFVDDDLNPDFVDFQAFVYAWDGSKITGSSLFSTGALSTTNNGGADGFEAITISTGGISLTSGAQYVAFFSASNLFDGSPGTSDWGLTGDVYDGGNFVFQNNGDDFGLLSVNAWNEFDSDLAFVMDFSPSDVPEPSVLMLLSLGLLSMGGALKGRRRT